MSKVLYAEDEFTNRKLLELLLQREGVECDLAPDGIAALNMFRTNKYSVVILDHYMPGMSGADVARRIRSLDKDVPLIALTSDDSQVPDLESAGFDRVFIKPLRGGDYIGAIVSYT
jgi:CheY-like chemotaxis protein